MAVVITGNNTPTAGGVTYGDGTTYATTSAGTSGQVLTSNGASAPTWGSASAPTTAQVLTATAGLTFGAIGSYAFLGQQTAAALEPGDTQAGSELRYTAIFAGAAPGNVGLSNAKGSSTNLPSGTWRCLGYGSGGSAYAYTLFIRIS